MTSLSLMSLRNEIEDMNNIRVGERLLIWDQTHPLCSRDGLEVCMEGRIGSEKVRTTYCKWRGQNIPGPWQETEVVCTGPAPSKALVVAWDGAGVKPGDPEEGVAFIPASNDML